MGNLNSLVRMYMDNRTVYPSRPKLNHFVEICEVKTDYCVNLIRNCSFQVLGLIEIGTEGWILSQMPWNYVDMMKLDLEERLIAYDIGVMKGTCVAGILLGLLRIASVYYLYISRDEVKYLSILFV